MAPSALRKLAAPAAAALLACCTAVGNDPTDTSTDDPTGQGPEGAETETGPLVLQPAVLPRLTIAQYRSAVAYLLGGATPDTELPGDEAPHLFTSIGAATTSLSELGTEQLEKSADLLAGIVFDNPGWRAALVGCTPTAPGDSCSADFVMRFGRRAYRRPLTAEEQTRWLGVTSAVADGDPWMGLRGVVTGMLQSPHFVYRVELGQPDGDGRHRYTGYEMASRLAFTLWNTTPDDALLDAAGAGELDDAAGVEARARTMLDDPRAARAIEQFFDQYLDLKRLDKVSRNPASYPASTPTLTSSMRTEVRLIVDNYVNYADTDARQIFSSRLTYLNSELASLYGVDAPGATQDAFVPYMFEEDSVRAGILTLGAFLTMNAHESDTSPTLRGKYVRERVLCQHVPAPPDDADIDLTPKAGDPPTLRERLDQHRDDPACASCHAFVDPPGYLFQNFDSIGAYRTTENGYPIDATGDLDGEPLADARDLAEILRDHERVGPCMVRQLYRHTQSRLDAEGEERALAELSGSFADSGHRFRELLVALVAHESFRFVAPPTETN